MRPYTCTDLIELIQQTHSFNGIVTFLGPVSDPKLFAAAAMQGSGGKGMDGKAGAGRYRAGNIFA